MNAVEMAFRNKNHEIAEFVFDAMRKFSFKPYDIEYGNGYFLFDMGDDSVVHFRVKGVWKHWKFGMWVHSEYLSEDCLKEEAERKPDWREGNKVVQIFAQYDTQIDKFKPSRSELLVEYEAREWKDIVEKYKMYELMDMLKMMRQHPFMCYNGFCGERPGYWYGSFVLNFIKYESYEIVSNIKKGIAIGFWYPYTRLKCALAKRSKCISELCLYDFEKENPGWSTDYRYGVRITFAADATESDEVSWLNRWFRKLKYGQYAQWDYAIEVQPLCKENLEGNYSYAHNGKRYIE